jgi:MoaA/NifB/PqqE/SkfB family radical SAM enzyme
MNNLDRVQRFRAGSELAERFASFLDVLSQYPNHLSPPLSFYKSLQATLRGGRRTAPCIFRRGGFFLEPSGNVLPCWRSAELTFGSVAAESFGEIWNGERRRRVIATIEEHFCNSCPSPCYVGFKSELLAPAGPVPAKSGGTL